MFHVISLLSDIATARNSSCGKVMFLQVFICPREGTCMAGGMHGRGHAW